MVIVTTNSTEYQRGYQKEYRKTHPQKQYKKVKIKKVKISEVKISELKPPKVEKRNGIDDIGVGGAAPTRNAEREIPISARIASDDSKTFAGLDLKYQRWCLSLETQRHYYYTKFGKTHRKNTKAVKKDLLVKNQELDMIELMKKEKAPLYRDCMNEFRELLKKKNAD